MKRLYSASACFRHALKKIHLVDKCLIFIMLVLLLQSTYSLFADQHPSGESNQIDVIIRTASASIFGYILSGNFIRHSKDDKHSSSAPHPAKTLSNQGAGPQASIGFAPPQEVEPPLEPGGATAEPDTDDQQSATAGCLQILVASGICLFCLIVLTVLRNVPALMSTVEDSPSVQATVAQFRDIVSGCVGFLIGCPTVSTSQK